LIIEARWADGKYDRLPALMAEVLGQKVDVLVTYGTEAAVAAKSATSTVPVVVAGMSDPIRSGVGASLARPGGNVTGFSMGFDQSISGKWLELLHEMVPQISTVAVIANPDNLIGQRLAKDLENIAPARALKLRLIEVRAAGALDRAFEQAGRKAQGVLVVPDSLFGAHRWQVAALAAKYRLPDMYPARDYVEAGGLMSYGPDFSAGWRRAAEYVDKILKGAKPGDLPIEQPTKFEMVINLKTAKALGLTVPENLLLQADEVIR